MRSDFLLVWIDAFTRLFKGSNTKPGLTGCLNCGYDLDNSTKFCPECGQKARVSKITVMALLGELFTNIFNIDNSFYRSIFRLFFPGFLPKAYVEGRRKKYLNPIRLFLVSVVIGVTIISSAIELDGLMRNRENDIKSVGQSELVESYTLWRDSTVWAPAQLSTLDSLESSVFSGINRAEHDTINPNFQAFGIDLRERKFLRNDFMLMDKDKFLEKYKVESFWERVIITQIMKLMRKPDGAATFAIGNILWGTLCSIILMAAVLKLLYIRRNRYYVEHLVLLFNIHTVIFILVSILLLPKAFFDISFGTDENLILCAGMALYIAAAIKVFYGQGYIKTILKTLISGFIYILIFSLSVFLVVAMSFFLYT